MSEATVAAATDGSPARTPGRVCVVAGAVICLVAIVLLPTAIEGQVMRGSPSPVPERQTTWLHWLATFPDRYSGLVMAAHLVFGLFLVAGGAALIRRRAWSRPALEAGCWVALVYTGVMGLAECLWSLVFMWQRVPVSIVLHTLFMFAALFQLRPLRLAALVSMIVVLRGAPVRSALQMTRRAPGGVA